MAKKRKTSSPKKRTKKAATPRRCTTSSTTANKAAQATSDPPIRDQPVADEPTTQNLPRGLTSQQQTFVLDLLARGASPAAACVQMGIETRDFLSTANADAEFRQRVRSISELLSGNVKAVLYRTAMEGNVSAQQAWLKLFPPPSFDEPATETEPMTFDELLGDLTDDELAELALAMGVDLPDETSPSPVAPRVSCLAEQLSERFAALG